MSCGFYGRTTEGAEEGIPEGNVRVSYTNIYIYNAIKLLDNNALNSYNSCVLGTHAVLLYGRDCFKALPMR